MHTVLNGSRRGPERNEPDMAPFTRRPGDGGTLAFRVQAIAYYRTLPRVAILVPLPSHRYLRPGERVYICEQGGHNPQGRFGLVNVVRGLRNPRGKNTIDREPYIMVNPDSLWEPPFNGKQGAHEYLPHQLLLFAGWR